MVSEITNRRSEYSVEYSQLRAVIFSGEPVLNLGLIRRMCRKSPDLVLCLSVVRFRAKY